MECPSCLSFVSLKLIIVADFGLVWFGGLSHFVCVVCVWVCTCACLKLCSVLFNVNAISCIFHLVKLLLLINLNHSYPSGLRL